MAVKICFPKQSVFRFISTVCILPVLHAQLLLSYLNFRR